MNAYEKNRQLQHLEITNCLDKPIKYIYNDDPNSPIKLDSLTCYGIVSFLVAILLRIVEKTLKKAYNMKVARQLDKLSQTDTGSLYELRPLRKQRNYQIRSN